MESRIHTPNQGPPTGPKPSAEIYKAMKEEGIYRMIAHFYRLLGESPIKHMFPNTEAGLMTASKKNAAFFIQILGGPPLYSEQFGAPQMRKRHLAFHINDEARGHWLACFFRVLEDAPAKYGFPMEHLEAFKNWLSDFSAWMVNRAD